MRTCMMTLVFALSLSGCGGESSSQEEPEDNVLTLSAFGIDEIDLPQIIRDSTSGIAGDAMNTVRRQGIGADQLVSRLADRVVFRRHGRKVDAPGNAESIAGRFAEDLAAPAASAASPDDAEERP